MRREPERVVVHVVVYARAPLRLLRERARAAGWRAARAQLSGSARAQTPPPRAHAMGARASGQPGRASALPAAACQAQRTATPRTPTRPPSGRPPSSTRARSPDPAPRVGVSRPLTINMSSPSSSGRSLSGDSPGAMLHEAADAIISAPCSSTRYSLVASDCRGMRSARRVVTLTVTHPLFARRARLFVSRLMAPAVCGAGWGGRICARSHQRARVHAPSPSSLARGTRGPPYV